MASFEFLNGKRILVTGGNGFVGRNLVGHLRSRGMQPVLASRGEYDLSEQGDVRKLMSDVKPDVVFHLAGLVGGILVNRERPGDFFYQNLMMGAMMLHESYRAGVKKYITLMGGCSYPANAPSPISEESLWDGYPQVESAPYSTAKKMSVVQAQSYRTQYGFNAIVLVPGNIYGPHDNFDLSTSHVIPALIRKFMEAKSSGKPQVTVWGSGKPVRDFVYISDAVEGVVLAADSYNSGEIINISSGVQTTIRELVETVAELCDFRGEIVWDSSKPDGQMYKGFAVERMKRELGFECKTTLRDGLKMTIEWYEGERG